MAPARRASICWSGATPSLRLAAPRIAYAEHARHRLHAVVGGGGGIGEGAVARGGRAAGQGFCHRRDRRGEPPHDRFGARAGASLPSLVGAARRSPSKPEQAANKEEEDAEHHAQSGRRWGNFRRFGGALRGARADAALAHGDVVAAPSARSRHVGRARRGTHKCVVRRAFAGDGARRRRGRAGVRGARRGRLRRRGNGPHRVVLLAGQGPFRGVLHHGSVRPHPS